ncbi:MAG: caspase family protein [Promethearchaeota archaeon]
MKRSHLLAILGLSLLILFLVPGIMPATANQRASTRGKPGAFVTITSPHEGDIVSGSVTILGDASKDPTISVDGNVLGVGWGIVWDTILYSDGSHTIKARIPGASDTVTVIVANGGPPPPPPGNKFAVVIGISNYDVLNDLSYCDDDARDWDNYLKGLGYGVTRFIDGQATESAVKTALINMVATTDSEDKILFISSGHGWVDRKTKRHMICMWDSEAGRNGEDGDITDLELQAIFAPAQASTFIFLDHCNSGGMDEVMHDNMYMTTTCGPNGYGYDMPDYENGAWTYWYLEQGLKVQGFTTAEECFAWAVAYYPFAHGQDMPREFDQYTDYFVF